MNETQNPRQERMESFMTKTVASMSIVVLLLIMATMLMIEEKTMSIATNNNDHNFQFPQHRRRLAVEAAAEEETSNKNDEFLSELSGSNLPLFKVSDFTTLGPTNFPKPTEYAEQKLLQDNASLSLSVVNYLKPVYGSHRQDADAVLAFAAEYPLKSYVLFLETLRETGYDGDVVLAVSHLDWADKNVKRYLSHDPHVIVYEIDIHCFNAEGEQVDSVKGGMRVCVCHQFYGTQDKLGKVTPMQDPRPARTVATTRYELYWLWTVHYSKHSWIMLIDARDTVFQTNPFSTVPRTKDDRNDGRLFFFGENIEATRIGQSKKNRKWIANAYGETVITAMQDKPTICSGSTMGEQVALETYLRAMVSESDETGTKLMGADQGFHNYLYYSNKLANAPTIHSITVFDQGRSIINNLGAMRIKELNEWGNGNLIKESNNKKTLQVLNWDGTLSPVVHQFDRHKLLSNYWYNIKTDYYMRQWHTKERQIMQQQKAEKQ